MKSTERTCYDFAVLNPKLNIKQLNQLYTARKNMLKQLGIEYK